ncbi:helix-turn-helix domain-containing protein [Rhodococcus koreensis]
MWRLVVSKASVSKLEWLTGLRGADLTHAEFRVLVALFTYTDAHLRNAYPSKATLAAAANVTPRTLTLALRTLQEKGLARIVQAGGNQHRKGAANVWELLPHNLPKGGAHRPPSEGAEGVDVRSPSRDEGSHPGPVKGVAEYQSRESRSNPPSDHGSDQRSGVARGEVSESGELPIEPPPRRCTGHLDDANPPSCHACGDARRTYEAWVAENVRAVRRAASDTARALAGARGRAIAACSLCDNDGYRGRNPCDHDPARDDRNRRGVELLRAVLDEKTKSA